MLRLYFPASITAVVILMAVSVLAGAAIASAAPASHSPGARAANTFPRCGTFRDRNSPFGDANEDEYGVYILKGRVACHTAIQVQTAVFAAKGEPAGDTAYVFYRGWYCDGQMGGYNCQNVKEHPGKRFAVLSCSAPGIGCPVSDSNL
jgi:hypothetical protein